MDSLKLRRRAEADIVSLQCESGNEDRMVAGDVNDQCIQTGRGVLLVKMVNGVHVLGVQSRPAGWTHDDPSGSVFADMQATANMI